MSLKKVLILGAGRSTFSLIDYLSNKASELDIEILVVDREAVKNSGFHPNSKASFFDSDLGDDSIRQKLIAVSDLVISMLPARFHLGVAQDCINFGKDMVTASYVTEEMQALDNEAKIAGITILNEVGLDPGIDHMSALKIIQEIQGDGGRIKVFESFTGGLLAPESEKDNPWQYKFTWNPRNVVMAGSGGAVKFIDNGMYKYIPYHKLFRRSEIINLHEYGKFEGYANRDSLTYRSLYGLDDVQTMFRGTLRRPGFCKGWDVFVQLGLTDDSFEMENINTMTNRSFLNSFLKYHPTDSVELKLMQYLKLYQDDVDIMEKLEWLDLFKEDKIELEKGSPAKILQSILEKKWKLKDEDKDMIVMWHRFIFEKDGVEGEIHSSMVVEGDDQNKTAMAKTVGYPLAMAAELILTEVFKEKGVHRPLNKSLYLPILDKLKSFDINFTEEKIR